MRGMIAALIISLGWSGINCIFTLHYMYLVGRIERRLDNMEGRMENLNKKIEQTEEQKPEWQDAMMKNFLRR